MEDNAGLFYILDGAVKSASGDGEAGMTPGGSAYEVIRIIRGIPLFYQDHFERMKSTFTSVGKSLTMSSDILKGYVKKLLEVNKLDFCNVKVVVSEIEGHQSVLAYISKSSYPSAAEADTGVKTGLLRLERNKPNAKIWNHSYKETVNAKIKDGGYYEVLLVDSRERITEGSKSNAFFVKGDRIFTAPGEFVLKGITRKYVLEACRKAGYEVVEEFTAAEGLERVDGAFLSGTSIKVLPISSIDDVTLSSSANSVVAAVRKEYDLLLEKYIDENAKIW